MELQTVLMLSDEVYLFWGPLLLLKEEAGSWVGPIVLLLLLLLLSLLLLVVVVKIPRIPAWGGKWATQALYWPLA
jgi:hypothetical protein